MNNQNNILAFLILLVFLCDSRLIQTDISTILSHYLHDIPYTFTSHIEYYFFNISFDVWQNTNMQRVLIR